MALRCKEGDIAIIIKSSAGNEGKQVTCLQYIGQVPPMYDKQSNRMIHLIGDDFWEIDRMLPTVSADDVKLTGRAFPYAQDSCLLPIGNDKNEEFVTDQEKIMEV